MGNLIACNLGSYGGFTDAAMEHWASLGMKYVEIGCPPPGEVAAVQARLSGFGLAASSVMAACPVAEPDLAERMKPACAAAAELGAKIVFVSAHAGEVPLPEVYARLHAAGDVAADAGVTIALETHPDLCENGAQMCATMAGVGHPNVRVNFDTANIHYYNQGVDTVAELQRAADVVASLHLKDTNGAYRTWYFPTLGEGIVDFPKVFAIMAARGFTGPYTMELEGIEGQNLDFAGRAASVAASLAHLRANGLN